MKFLQLFETPQTVTAHNYNTQHYDWYCPSYHLLLTAQNLQYRSLVFRGPNCFKSRYTNRASSHFNNYRFCKHRNSTIFLVCYQLFTSASRSGHFARGIYKVCSVCNSSSSLLHSHIIFLV